MLFHTWLFLLFFIVAYGVYLALRNTRFRLHWLLAISYFFYAGWNPLYLPLIVFSTLVDYLAVNFMQRTGRKKLWLVISLVNNLGLLAFFKYADFFTQNMNVLLEWVGFESAIDNYADKTWEFGSNITNSLFETFGFRYRVPAEAVLPVGISFFTFQSMSYTIDFYRGRIEREPNFIKFAAYVALFPQLVAGPIERATNLLPQLAERPRITRADVTDGLSLFVVGLFKKVAMADYLAYTMAPDDPLQERMPGMVAKGVADGYGLALKELARQRVRAAGDGPLNPTNDPAGSSNATEEPKPQPPGESLDGTPLPIESIEPVTPASEPASVAVSAQPRKSFADLTGRI